MAGRPMSPSVVFVVWTVSLSMHWPITTPLAFVARPQHELDALCERHTAELRASFFAGRMRSEAQRREALEGFRRMLIEGRPVRVRGCVRGSI